MAEKKNETTEKITAMKGTGDTGRKKAGTLLSSSKKTKKDATRKAAKKNPDRVQEVFFEFNGKKIEAGQVVSQVEEAYKADGHQIGRIRDLKIYINPDESRAYYVINGNAENKYIDL